MYKSQIKSNPCEQSNCSWPLQISLQGYRRKELVYLELLLVGKLSNTSDPRLNRWSAYRGAWFLGLNKAAAYGRPGHAHSARVASAPFAGLASDGRWQHSIRPRCGRGRLPALRPWPGCRRCLARVAVSMGAEPRAAERCVGCVTGYVCVCRARPRAGLPSAIDAAERALARAKAKKGGPCNRQRRGRSGVGAQRSW